MSNVYLQLLDGAANIAMTVVAYTDWAPSLAPRNQLKCTLPT